MEEKESDNIELRSEKVRNVIGEVPPRLVNFGTIIITIIILAITVAFFLMKGMIINIINATWQAIIESNKSLSKNKDLCITVGLHFGKIFKQTNSELHFWVIFN